MAPGGWTWAPPAGSTTPACGERWRSLKAIDEPLLEHPSAYRPEVAAVIDEHTVLRLAAGSTVVTRPAIYEVRAALGRMGTPYGQYLLDDVLAGRVHARLFIMLNAWRFSATNGPRSRKSFAGPRWSGATRRDISMATSPRPKPCGRSAGSRWLPARPPRPGKADGGWHPAGPSAALRPDQPVRPLFSAAGLVPEQVLAAYPDGSAAVALRRSPDGVRFFVGVPGLTSDLLRITAREAGVHLFTETDCNVYARAPFLVLHASNDGPIVVTLPARPGQVGGESPWRVSDVLSGELVGRGPKLRLSMRRGDTKVLRYD